MESPFAIDLSACYCSSLSPVRYENNTNDKKPPQRRLTNLSIDVVVHGDVGVWDVDLNVEVGDVLDPRVVAVPHQRLHRNDCVN